MQRGIYLIGFMGAGKTTFGRKLAGKLGFEFVDLDELISIKYQVVSIKILIEEKGFNFFREIESETLKGLDAGGKVVSAGGGTPCYFDNMQWMKEHGIVVYLDLDEKTLFNRLKQTRQDERPLIKGLDDEGLKKFISETLASRLPFYTQADISFNPIRQSIEELLLQLETLNFEP